MTKTNPQDIQWVETASLVGAQYDWLDCAICYQDVEGKVLQLTLDCERFICPSCVALISNLRPPTPIDAANRISHLSQKWFGREASDMVSDVMSVCLEYQGEEWSQP